MKPILLLLFAATAACVGALLPLISRARSKRLLLNAVRRASSDAPDGIGISVLCSGVTDAAQIENLLSPEYSRYEVIVVLDARRHAARIGQRGVDIARIAVGEFHRNALPQEGGVLFGVNDLHAERPQRIAVGIAFERRAAGGQQAG